MQHIQVLFIAPYAEICPLIEEVSRQYPQISENIFVGSYDDAVRAYPFLLTGTVGSGIDIVVARGYTAEQLLLRKCNPVVEIETSLYDTLRAIKTAQQCNEHFAVVGSKMIIASARQLINVLRMDNVPLIDISSRQMAVEEVRKLHASGVSLIVGDLFAVDACHELGIHSILISSGKASIEHTFQSVIRLYNNISASERSGALYKNALQYSGHSVLVFSEQMELLFSNEDKEKPLPESLRADMPKILSRISTDKTLTLKKVVGNTLYKLSVTYVREEAGFYIVHIRPYERYAYTAMEEFLQLVNPLEWQGGDLSFSGADQLFPIHALPKGVNRSFLGSIMLYGEIGTGKEFLARMYWQNSEYSRKPLLLINCGNLTKARWDMLTEHPDSIIYELDYTILFKNIHLLTLEMQFAINTFLENTCFKRNHIIISTSAVHLGALVTKGEFLGELYQKISDYEQHLSSLSDKPEQIKTIVDYCISHYNVIYNREVVGLEAEALMVLEGYTWCNNIAQLQDTIKYAVTHTDSPYITKAQIEDALARFLSVSDPPTVQQLHLNGTLAEMEAQIIQIVVEQAGGRVSEAARRLGISRTTLWRILKSQGK